MSQKLKRITLKKKKKSRTIVSICVVQNLKVPVLVGGKALVHVKHFSCELLADVT